MSSSFAQLFRASKFATYDATIKQVYTSPEKAKKYGDWGLKRTLPRSWRSDLIHVKAIDTSERMTPFESALNDVLFKKRFAANFGSSDTFDWTGFSATRLINLNVLTDKEYLKFKEKVRSLREEWKKKDLTARNQPLAVEKFIGIETALAATSMSRTKAPICYRANKREDKVVLGRILNAVPNSIIVGVNGITCTFTETFGQRKNMYNPYDHELRQFIAGSTSSDPENRSIVLHSYGTKAASLPNAYMVASLNKVADIFSQKSLGPLKSSFLSSRLNRTSLDSSKNLESRTSDNFQKFLSDS